MIHQLDQLSSLLNLHLINLHGCKKKKSMNYQPFKRIIIFDVQIPI
jgi:hypothetical protein